MIGPLLSLVAVLLAVGGLTFAAAAGLIAYGLLRPPRMTDGKALYLLRRLSPEDVGLRYEAVTFAVRDERTGRPLTVAGWWMPAAADAGRCAVLIHGYADAKVGAVAWAVPLHALGFHVLAIDLRAHGESGGINSTAGYWERHDVAQVIDQLRAARPVESRQVVLFGASLGAAVAAAVAVDRAAHGDVAAVVLESPYADFRRAATARLEQLGLPGGALAACALRVAQWASGADFDAVRPVDLIARVACPVLVIACDGGGAAELGGDVAALEAAVRARLAGAPTGVFRLAAGAPHLMAMAVDPERYLQWLREFFAVALAPLPTSDRSDHDGRHL